MKAFFKVATFVVLVFVTCHLIVSWIERKIKEDWSKFKERKESKKNK